LVAVRNLLKIGIDNPVMVNIISLAVLAAGLYSACSINRDVLPELRTKNVVVVTRYPGAAPEDVERGVTDKIEDAIEDVDGIDRILSVTTEGYSRIVVELTRETDLDRAVDDIKAAVDGIDDFADEVEEPVVSRFDPKWWVISVALYGDVTDKELKRLTEDFKDEIRDLLGISDTIVYGVRDEQINVEVDPEMLQAHRLGLLDIVNAISQANLDVPGGVIRMPEENISVRTLGERRTAQTIRQIVVRARPGGQILTVGQLARVEDGFVDADIYGRFNGKRAASVTIFRSSGQDAIDVSNKIRALVAGKMGQPVPTFGWVDKIKYKLGLGSRTAEIYRQGVNNPIPPGVYLAAYDDISRFIRDRLDLLRRNGIWGLTLVFLSLLIFLNRWVAFWVMTGVAISLLGAIAVMNGVGFTLNMVSMFGLIVALGLLVDDAIVIGESVFYHLEAGDTPKLAAVRGAHEVAVPVIIAVLTTICAFIPLSMISGRMGDILGVLPLVASIALTISLFEALFLLPSHLSEFLKKRKSTPPSSKVTQARQQGPIRRWLARFRTTGVDELLRRPYSRVIRLAVTYRYTAVVIAFSLFAVCVGLIAGRRVALVSFPKMDTDFVVASLRMPVGTPVEKTEQVLRRIEKAADTLPEIKHYYTLIGARLSEDEPTISAPQSHIGQVMIELIPMEQRRRTSEQIILELRRLTADLTGIDSLQIVGMGGARSSDDLAVEVTGDQFEHVLPAVQHMKRIMGEYAGVYDLRDDFETGRREIKIELLPSARALGLNTQLVSLQIRSAFQGIEARTIQRGREPIDIMVRYGLENRDRLSDLEHMWISTPTGVRVPLTEVAVLREGVGYAAVNHTNRHRAVRIYGQVDPALGNADDIMTELEQMYPKLQLQHPGVRFASTGSRREFARAIESLKTGFLVAVLLIYVCLACLFRSYVQPLIVMISIPMAFIGVVLGHWVMGYPITLLSRIGYIALAGIAVNDALILVDYANRQVRCGRNRYEAIYEAGLRRLRPILLTSLTTILGLAPLMAERSFQARFLIPMAISITFGLAIVTFLTLLLVPALYMIFEDVRRMGRWLWHGQGEVTRPEPALAPSK